MGRFYKATPARFIDGTMYETPFKEIAATTMALDKNIDEVYDTLEEQSALVKAERLKTDDDEVKRRLDYYNNQIDSMTQSMNADVLSFAKQRPLMRSLSRGLSKDLGEGIFGYAEKNLKEKKDLDTEIDKRTDLDLEHKQVAKDFAMHNYKGLNYDEETGKYNKFSDSTENTLQGVGDENSYLATVGSDFKKQLMNKTATGDSRAEVTDDRIREYVGGDLDKRGYVESQEQFYQRQMDMDSTFEVRDANGNVMTAKEIAEQDKKDLQERAVEKYEESSGVKSYAPSRGSSSGKVVVPDNLFLVGSPQNIAPENIGEVTYNSVVDDTAVVTTNLLANVKRVDTLSDKANKARAERMVQDQFTVLFDDVLGITSGGGYKLENLNKIISFYNNNGIVKNDDGTTNAEKTLIIGQDQAINILNTHLQKDVKPTQITSGQLIPEYDKVYRDNVAIAIAGTDPNEPFKGMYLYKDGVQLDIKGVNTLAGMAELKPEVFTSGVKPTKINTTKLLGSDEDGWKNSDDGEVLKSNKNFEYTGADGKIKKVKVGQQLKMDDLRELERTGDIMEGLDLGKNVTISIDNMIMYNKKDPNSVNNFKQRIYGEILPFGAKKDSKEYMYTRTIQVFNEETGKQETYVFKIIADPDKYPVTINQPQQ